MECNTFLHCLVILLHVAVAIAATDGVSTRLTYRAAVYDLGYEEFVSTDGVSTPSREEALKTLTANLNTLKKQASIAAEKGADIFVFPEYGLSGRLQTREVTFHYLETIPDPTVTTYCPCDSARVPGQEILYELSCAAKEYDIYIAANMGDKQPCLKEGDSNVKCPINGFYQYNTEVVFNQTGCLVARYHKQHLFTAESLRWDEPRVPEISYFDTQFGRFGLMICFDAVFRSPAIDLVEKHNVTDIIFSTAWMNVFPHYMSVAYHSGWARQLRVNYLMSNLHNIPFRLVGSGIYTINGIAEYQFNMEDNRSKLIIADVPINYQTSGNQQPNEADPLIAEVLASTTSTADYFEQKVFGDTYKFVKLTGLSGNVSVCHTDGCCYMNYQRTDDQELFALGIFQGMHYIEGTYYLEVCVLVKCKDGIESGCGLLPETSNATTFTYLRMTGDLNTPYVFPGVMFANNSFSEDFQFHSYNNSHSILLREEQRSPISVSLMGRNFDKDPMSDTSDGETTTNLSTRHQLASLLLILVYLFHMI